MINSSEISIFRVQDENLDASNAAKFKVGLLKRLEEHPNLLLELSATQFMDSSALGAILSGLRKANRFGGTLAVCGLTKPVRALFELVRMHRIITIFNDESEAKRAFERAA